MRIGVFADSHDHIDNVRHAVSEFNRQGCDLVIFTGDLVSPIAVPPLRRLNCRVMGCFGDSDGNKIGIAGGMRIVGTMGEPPFCFQTTDGTRILVTHAIEDVRGLVAGCDVVVSSHTHKPNITRDRSHRLYVNPGETSGWTYRKPSIAILETDPLGAKIISLPEMPPVPLINRDVEITTG